MKLKKLSVLILAFLPLVVTLFVLPMLPETIPAHYGFSGAADRFGSKYELFTMPGLNIGLWAILLLVGKAVKKEKDKAEQNAKVLFAANLFALAIFNAVTYWFLYLAYRSADNLLETDVDAMRIVAVIISLLLVLLGNILPKCKRNEIIGIRTKWTLESDDV